MASPAPAPSPMLIPIHSDGEIPEWAMLELNGELLRPKEEAVHGKENPSIDSDSNDDDENLVPPRSMELGAVNFDKDTPVMTLGSHQLTGTVERLQQPFCVLSKQYDKDKQVSYAISGVVTQKLLFTQYPKTIMR